MCGTLTSLAFGKIIGGRLSLPDSALRGQLPPMPGAQIVNMVESVRSILLPAPRRQYRQLSRKKEKRKSKNSLMSEKYLEGQLAIVTGSSKVVGIGSATALALAEHGANVLYC